MDERELKAALEAIIFASGEPVPAGRISLVLGVPEAEVYSCAEALAEEYEREGQGLPPFVRLDKSLQMCSAPAVLPKAGARVIEHRAPPKLSPPALETLAVIAYFQPVTDEGLCRQGARSGQLLYGLLAGGQGPRLSPQASWRPRAGLRFTRRRRLFCASWASPSSRSCPSCRIWPRRTGSTSCRAPSRRSGAGASRW